MIEIEQNSRMSGKPPAMIPPLVNHLHFDGMTDYGNNILIVQAADILHLENHTKWYLQELAGLTQSLPDQAQPISLEEYTKEVSRLRKGTLSGPSNVNPTMVNTEVLDPELAKIGWRGFNFRWCTRYSPKRYRRGLDLRINKDPNWRNHILRSTLLFDIKANMHNKHLCS